MGRLLSSAMVCAMLGCASAGGVKDPLLPRFPSEATRQARNACERRSFADCLRALHGGALAKPYGLEGLDFAFVLLADPALPDLRALQEAYSARFSPEEPIFVSRADKEHLVLSVGGHRAGLSLWSGVIDDVGLSQLTSASVILRALAKLPPHRAALLVVSERQPAHARTAQLIAFTQLVAAVSDASSAVGVYWPQAGAAHEARWFQSLTANTDWLPLWTGLSVREGGGRVYIYSTGMEAQFGLMDLLVTARKRNTARALEVFYQVLREVQMRGEVFPAGRVTLGGVSVDIRHVRAPFDPVRRIWTFDLE